MPTWLADRQKRPSEKKLVHVMEKGLAEEGVVRTPGSGNHLRGKLSQPALPGGPGWLLTVTQGLWAMFLGT